jgi:hypothetical protein
MTGHSAGGKKELFLVAQSVGSGHTLTPVQQLWGQSIVLQAASSSLQVALPP